MHGMTARMECRYVTVAGAIGRYYWTRGNRQEMPRFPVVHAMHTAFRSGQLNCIWYSCMLTNHTRHVALHLKFCLLPMHIYV